LHDIGKYLTMNLICHMLLGMKLAENIRKSPRYAMPLVHTMKK
jgi:HD superfamily phosphodiesterase